MRNKCLLILVCILLVGPLADNTLASGGSCSDLALIFARGSGQNPNHEFLDSPENKDYFGKEEVQSYTFFKEISSRFTGLSVEKISLHDFGGRYNPYGYQAVNVAYGFTHGPEHRTDVPNRYYESVADGAEELAWFLEDRLTSCPFQQIILGGYSQGAHVVGDALFKLKPNLRPRLAYVALFGDPKFNPRTSAIPVITGPWVRGTATSTQTGALLARKDYLPDEIAFKTSWCDSGDPVCANYSIFNNSAFKTIYDLFMVRVHQENYQNRWIAQAANEIVTAVKARTPSLAGKIQTTPWVNKNDKLYQLDLALVIDTTGSMSGLMNSIKDRLDSFVSALYNSYWDTRVGIVGFNEVTTGYPYGTPSYYCKIFSDFTYDKTQTRSTIQAIKTGGGGDEPEALYSGLMAAMDTSLMHWRTGAQKKILVLTDATAKNPDPGPSKWTKEQVVKRALELDPVGISVLAPPLAYPWPYTNQTLNAQLDSSFKSTVTDLATDTNGLVSMAKYDYYSADYPSKALSAMAIQPVAEIIGPTSGYVGEPVLLSGGSSYDPDSVVTSYSWDCNNDGVWEIKQSTSAIAECNYSAPYSGLVVLEVNSSDGGSAKAVLNVSVEVRAITNPVIEPPAATAVRTDVVVNVSWQSYPEGVSVLIVDSADNTIAMVSNGTSYTVTDAPATAFSLKLKAGSGGNWSEYSTVNIPQLVLPGPSITPAPTVTPTTTPAPTVGPNTPVAPVLTVMAENLINQAVQNASADEPKSHITAVKGAQSTVTATVTKKPAGINIKLVLLWLLIIACVIGFICLPLRRRKP